MSNLSLFLGLVVLPLFATWSDDWDSIRRAADQIQTLEADFVQTKNLEILSKPLVSRGTLSSRRPGELRWEYQSPLRSVLLANPRGVKRYVYKGGKWVPDAGAKVEAIRAVLAEMNLWLRGSFQESKVFEATLRSGSPTRIELVPRDAAMKKYITRIWLVLGEKPGVLTAIDIEESKKASTHIEFSNVKLNAPIPSERFEPPR